MRDVPVGLVWREAGGRLMACGNYARSRSWRAWRGVSRLIEEVLLELGDVDRHRWYHKGGTESTAPHLTG